MGEPKKIFDFDRIREDLAIAERNFLRERGWNYTCDFPVGIWLWSKNMPEYKVVCDARTAMRFERIVDEHGSPEKCFECGGTGTCDCYGK